MAISEANLDALVRLLAEPDSAAAEPLIAQLAVMDQADLAQVAARCDGPAQANLHRAQVRRNFLSLDADWSEVIAGNADLERALTLISRTWRNPTPHDIERTLDQLAEEVGARLSGDRAFDSGLGALAQVLWQEHGLRGNEADYYAPENAYLGSVLENGLGNPITLCSVAILVGRRLELPVFGVNSPGHFLGFYGDAHLGVGSFFDPFDGYRRVTSGEVQVLLGQFVDRVEPGMLRPASDREIISRCLRNLAGSYTRLNQPEQVRHLERWNHSLGP